MQRNATKKNVYSKHKNVNTVGISKRMFSLNDCFCIVNAINK